MSFCLPDGYFDQPRQEELYSPHLKKKWGMIKIAFSPPLFFLPHLDPVEQADVDDEPDDLPVEEEDGDEEEVGDDGGGGDGQEEPRDDLHTGLVVDATEKTGQGKNILQFAKIVTSFLPPTCSP